MGESSVSTTLRCFHQPGFWLHQFRTDLFYRLSAFPIEPPPLRDLAEEIRLFSSPILQSSTPLGCANKLRPFQRNSWRRWYGIPGRVTSVNCKT
jgi:transcriptional regulator of aromatic amino acid metabolism